MKGPFMAIARAAVLLGALSAMRSTPAMARSAPAGCDEADRPTIEDCGESPNCTLVQSSSSCVGDPSYWELQCLWNCG
jgi:hypothetical protein